MWCSACAWGSGISRGCIEEGLNVHERRNDRRYLCFKTQQNTRHAASHLVKHTADILISSGRTTLVVMVMVVHRRAAHAHGWRTRGASQTGRIGHSGSPRSLRARAHIGWMPRGHLLVAGVDLGLPPDASASKTHVRVAVPPAVHSPLDKTALSTQTRVQLCKGPAHHVTLGLVVEAVALVIVFAAVRTRIHAVF